ncbi:MAG: BamA/TamA family outer membrane protein [Alistipes sp.]|nr:BamA/TamA family outer membrane protein [Alistipes sp.]
MTLKKILLPVLILALSGFPLSAQEDTDKQFEEVIAADTSAGLYTSYYYDQIELDVLEERPGFFRRLGNYFRESNIDKTHDKKIDYSFIGGPHYSSNVKLGLGLMAAGLYRLDRTDMVTPPSNISVFGDITTSGFYLIGIRGYTFFDAGKYRIDYKTTFSSMPTDFWGIGYDMGKADSNKTSFVRKQASVKLDFMYRFFNGFYGGVNFGFDYIKGKDFDDVSYLRGQKTKYNNNSYGLFLMYDSRDYITAPQTGWYVKLENVTFPGFTGNKPHFNRMELTVDFFHPVWKGGTLAYDFHTLYNSGNVPWTMLAQLGGSTRMRGYYEGRYRDKVLMEVQAELRQWIWRRIGVAVWGGAGNVFEKPSRFEWSHTLPTYGLGFRWEFKKRVNVRLDYGFGKGESAFVFNINEAF